MTTDVLPAPVVVLIDAARQALEGGQPAMGSVADENLTPYAQRHGMLAWMPLAGGETERRWHMIQAIEGIRLLRMITGALAAEKIRAVALKGPAFSQWLYGDPCARRFSDLDLLVDESRRHEALDVLASLGFVPRLARGAGDVVYGRIGAWPMDRQGGPGVDVHWRLAGVRFPEAVSASDVFERAIDVDVGGRQVRVPCADHAAALTLAHAAKHVWYALELPFSIATLVRRSDIDWLAVRRSIAAAGVLRGAAAGLTLADRLFHSGVPLPFRGDIERPEVEELCQCAWQTLALPPGTFPDRRLERRMHRLALDHAADRVRYDVRRMVDPTPAEAAWVRLPRPLSGLYWTVRLARIGTMLLRKLIRPRA